MARVKKCLAALALLCGSAHAGEAPSWGTDEGQIWGAGRASCFVWIGARQSDHSVAAALAEWVSGYISAFNVQENETAKLSDIEVDHLIDDWLATYCPEHKNDTLGQAAQAFLADRAAKH